MFGASMGSWAFLLRKRVVAWTLGHGTAEAHRRCFTRTQSAARTFPTPTASDSDSHRSLSRARSKGGGTGACRRVGNYLISFDGEKGGAGSRGSGITWEDPRIHAVAKAGDAPSSAERSEEQFRPRALLYTEERIIQTMETPSVTS